jgi:hypothetical protein
MIPVTPRTVEHLQFWCACFQEAHEYMNPKHIRFSIGVYQISQGLSWKITSPVRCQSFCAAAMHFIMCAHAHGIDLSAGFPDTLAEIDAPFDGWDNLLLKLGKAQQQVVYALSEVSHTARASRFKRDVLEQHLHYLVKACFSLTYPDYREQGCFDEMKILTGDLIK